MNKILTAALSGLRVNLITVETDTASGLPGFTIVGLADKAVSESKERVRAAIKHSHLQFPQKKVTINLSPADIKKEGASFDLAIAAAVLKSSEQLPKSSHKYIYFGELSLTGEIKPVRGIVPLISGLYRLDPELVFVISAEQYKEANLVKGANILALGTLAEYAAFERGELNVGPQKALGVLSNAYEPEIDFSFISGQAHIKRALEVAAAGGHHVLMSGPPGSGKTLLSKAFAGILPPLSEAESLEVNSIYSAAGLLSESNPTQINRPFRSPHHTASAVALVGGGRDPKPGEITLAHRGVLFLDELPEFPRFVLEALREPLEDRKISVARAAGSECYPASFQLIASQNPCPCGNYGSSKNICNCTVMQIMNYQKKTSGALLDRIDIRLSVPAHEGKIFDPGSGESSATIRDRVIQVREIQRVRYGKEFLNAELTIVELKRFAYLTSEAEALLNETKRKLEVSMRSIHKVIKVARTIADLSDSVEVSVNHVAEALQYRFAKESAQVF